MIPSDAATVAKTRASGERPVVGRRWRRQIGRLQEQQPGGFEQELGPIRPSIFRNSPGQADRPEGQRETTGEDGRDWQRIAAIREHDS